MYKFIYVFLISLKILESYLKNCKIKRNVKWNAYTEKIYLNEIVNLLKINNK